MPAAGKTSTVKLGIAIGCIVIALGLLGWYYLGPKGTRTTVNQAEQAQAQQQLEEQQQQLRQATPAGATTAGE